MFIWLATKYLLIKNSVAHLTDDVMRIVVYFYL